MVVGAGLRDDSEWSRTFCALHSGLEAGRIEIIPAAFVLYLLLGVADGSFEWEEKVDFMVFAGGRAVKGKKFTLYSHHISVRAKQRKRYLMRRLDHLAVRPTAVSRL